MPLYTVPRSAPPLTSRLLSVLVPAVLTAGFAPLLVLTSYVVRLTVVARRTADVFPFSSQLRHTVTLHEEFCEDRRVRSVAELPTSCPFPLQFPLPLPSPRYK